jgi:uncharacterized protein (DUF927 family)
MAQAGKFTAWRGASPWVAAVGELASHYGLTGWRVGESDAAAQKCFAAWLDEFGGAAGNKEERAILSQVLAFFEAHGASRFEDLNSTVEQRVINRAGFFRDRMDDEESKREFLILPEAFRRGVCKGLDVKTATKALIQAGWLRLGDGKNIQRKESVPGMGQIRCYVFSARMWEHESGG